MVTNKAVIFGVILILLLAVSGCASSGGSGGVSMAGQLEELLGGITSTVSGIMGPDEAVGANHALMDMDAELADLVARATNESPEVQAELANVAKEALPGLEEVALNAMNIPGVAEAIGPTMKSITGRLTDLFM